MLTRATILALPESPQRRGLMAQLGLTDAKPRKARGTGAKSQGKAKRLAVLYPTVVNQNCLTLKYPPSDNHLFATVRGRRVLSAEGRAYHSYAADTAKAAGIEMLLGDVRITMRVYRPIMARDLQNCFKCAIDGLSGIAWKDDKQIKRIEAERFQDASNPRLEIEIFPLDE